MKSFEIGDFLRVESEGLAIDLVRGEVTGFSRLLLRDEGFTVELEAEAQATVEPPVQLVPRTSLIRFASGSVESSGGTADHRRIVLRPNSVTFASFHWPNPLTPHSRGLWLRLAMVRTEGRMQLSFTDDATQQDRGTGYFFQESEWRRFFLGTRTGLRAIPLREWREHWEPGREIGDAEEEALLAGALLSDPQAALIDGGRARPWRLGLRLVPAEERVLRLVAQVSDGDRDDDRQPVEVNARALRLEEVPEVQARPLRWLRTIVWRCASVRTGAAADPRLWAVDWIRIPTSHEGVTGRDQLSLRSFWQELARHWALGLRSARSRNALTFLPTDLRTSPGAAGQTWTFRFAVEQRTGGWRSRLVRVESGSTVPLQLVLGNALDLTGRPCVFDSNATVHGRETLTRVSGSFRDLIDLDLAPSPRGLGELLVGGVALGLDPLDAGRLRLGFADSPSPLGQPPLFLDLTLNCSGRLPRPATEDPERGFETENAVLRRERPLVVDLKPEAPGATTLTVRETADAGQSRVLELTVRNAAADPLVLPADVVVIDPAPFLVARVLARTAGIAHDGILATYRDDGEGPAGWQFSTDTGAMTLVLPPQAIGEEMIKGKLIARRGGANLEVPRADRPFDFRLSSTAHLKLDRTDVETARTAPPWTLRRLLDRREGVVGLKLDGARFELLYGLTTFLEEAAGLRLAELDSFVGRVPLARALFETRPGQAAMSEAERRYAAAFVAWVRGLRERPAQLPVFRDFAARERVVLSQGLRFAFRPSRQTADPFAVGRYHRSPTEEEVVPTGPDGERFPLRGGVDYPFESPNIYEAVLDPERSTVARPGESQGHVAGLVFGTLGGSGSQQASFDEGLTLIISETVQGRLTSLTLVRVGRIARLWNHARHVIVYERTTRTAPRFRELQPNGFEGLAALRKVKEYVEVTQPRRTYPDLTRDADRPLAGPVLGSFFETTVIPVKSSWGYDVDGGLVMALRGPLTAAEAQFYPFPKIFLDLARVEGKGGGKVSQLVEDPSRLLFFSTTRADLGGDPDAWPAWPDIDFPLTQRPQPPQVPFLPGFAASGRQPDAAAYDYGQRRFTIDVVPAEEAVNLQHGRPGPGLEARLRNVSLLRGGLPRGARSPVDEAVGRTFAEAEARIGDGLAELAQHLERLAGEGAGRPTAEIAGLKNEARVLLDRVRSDAERLLQGVASADALVGQQVDGWKSLQRDWLETARREGERARVRITGQLDATLRGVLSRLPAAGPPGAELRREAENRLRDALETVCRQGAERLESLLYLPEQALERLEAELRRAEAEVRGRIEGTAAAWVRTLDALAARQATEALHVLEAELIDALLATRERLVAFGATAARQVKDGLGPLFGDLPGGGLSNGAVGRLSGVVEGIAAAAVAGIDDVIDVIPPFELEPPAWPELRELLEGALPELPRWHQEDGSLIFPELQELIATLRGPVDAWRTRRREMIAALEAQCDTLADQLVAALGQGADALGQAIGIAVGAFAGRLAADAGDLASRAQETLALFLDNPVAMALQGTLLRVDTLRNQVLGRIAGLQRALEGTVGELAEAARQAAEQAGAGLRRVGEQIEEAVVRELRPLAEGVEGAALELARALAEGPVTDTLRCTRDWVGYYYDAARDTLDVTRAAAVFNDLGGNVLNSLAARVPFDRIRDRLLPQLANVDLNKLFPDFAGLKLEHLLGGLRIPTDPSGEYEWIQVRHGFDRARLTAWSEVSIDRRFDDDPELVSLPPVAVRVAQPHFTAKSRIEASREGLQAQETQARLVADWTVTLNGEPVMIIQRGGLFYDSKGGLRFDFEAKDLRLAPALQFVTDALRRLLPEGEGTTITPLFPGGVSVELSLPLPDIGTGAFTMTGVTLYSHFDLLVAGGFEVRTGLWLSRPERPFGLAVLFLGGGGWFGVDVRYKPPQEFETRVSVGVSAGAFVSLNFGVARGSAGVLLTAGLDFYRNWLQGGTQDLVVSIGLLVWGEFSLLGIASAYLRVVLRIEYRNGEMTGYGRVSVSIKICWCFTLRVDAPIRLPFKRSAARELAAGGAEAELLAPPPPPVPVRAAVAAHFANLDL